MTLICLDDTAFALCKDNRRRSFSKISWRRSANENELLQLYNQSVALKTSIDEYGEVLESQNNLALLNKAIQAGQISMIEYFVDVTTLYQSMQNHMQLQNEYQKVMAQLYKFKL